MSFRSIRTIAGPGGVIGPLPRPNEGGRTTGNKVAKKAEYINRNGKGAIQRMFTGKSVVILLMQLKNSIHLPISSILIPLPAPTSSFPLFFLLSALDSCRGERD